MQVGRRLPSGRHLRLGAGWSQRQPNSKLIINIIYHYICSNEKFNTLGQVISFHEFLKCEWALGMSFLKRCVIIALYCTGQLLLRRGITKAK